MVCCFYCCCFIIFWLLDFEFQENQIAKQFSATIMSKLRSKKAFIVTNNVRVRSPGVHLFLFFLLYLKLILNVLFRHLGTDDKGLDFIVKGDTEKFDWSLQKIVLHFVEIHPKGEKGWFFTFSWMNPPKTLGFKRGQTLQDSSGPQGSSSFLLYEDTSLDKLEKQEWHT